MLFKNLSSLVGAEAFSKLVTFAAFGYLARRIGPSGFGYVEWAGAVFLGGSLIVDQGFSSYGAREIAKSPTMTSRLVSEIVTARLLLAALGFVLISIFAFVVIEERLVRSLLLVYALSLWALPFLLQWVFQGHDKMHVVGIAQIIRQLVFAVTIVIFVRGIDDLVWVGFGELAGVAAAAVFTIVIYRRYFESGAVVRPAISTKLFREGAPIGLSQMFWVAKMFGATFILGLIATAEDTGVFAGAMRIYIAIHTFVWLYYYNLLPSMSRAWQEGPEHLSSIVGRSLVLVAAVCLISGIVWVAAASTMMVSVYGQGFETGGRALQWLAGACIAAAVSGHYRYALIAAGHQNKEMLAMAAGSVFALAFIPVGYMNGGIAAAAGVLFAAECIVLLGSWLSARRCLFSASIERAVDGAPMSALPDVTR